MWNVLFSFLLFKIFIDCLLLIFERGYELRSVFVLLFVFLGGYYVII